MKRQHITAHDAPSDTFKPYGDGRPSMKTECHSCHTVGQDSDFVFAEYAQR